MAIEKTNVTDPFKHLEENHAYVSEIFRKIGETSAGADAERTELFTRLKDALTLHAELEENTLYPLLKEKEETRDLAFEAAEEHQLVKTMLSEISGLDPTAEEWDAQVAVLKENVEHHVQEEEGDMFLKAREALTKKEQDALAADMTSFLERNA
ncbi:MAG TPA: hemerythrin domain-containing protein [Candidatus Paceibacterota bacterium]|nr:hemerythrin domain-containing protein [Candidatus Paceibacterota bacterium]